METPLPTEMFGLMLNNLLPEASIVDNSVQGVLLGHATESIHKNSDDCSNPNIFNILKTEENDLLNFSHNVFFTDANYVSTSAIKAEPEVDNFEIENIPLGTINYYKNSTFSQRDDKSPTSFSTQNEVELKSEPINDIGKIGGIVYEEFAVKSEELNIKEDQEQEGTSVVEPWENHATQTNTNSTINTVIKKEPGWENVPLNSSSCNTFRSMPEPNLIFKLEKLNVVEGNGKFAMEHSHKAGSPDLDSPTSFSTQLKSEAINDIGKIGGIIYEDWAVKSEELDIKEDLELEGTSIFPAGLSQDKKFKCSDCDFRTTRRYILKNHILRHMNSEDVKTFKCTDCDFRTTRRYTLKNHMLRHMNSEDVKNFKCNECDYRTFRKGSLDTHMLVHINSEDVKKFKCNDCNFRTVHRSNLKTHMLRHKNSEDVKKFKCNYCDYRAIQKVHLKTHMLRHINSEDVKNFKCNDCDYLTVHRGHFKAHILRHKNSEDVKNFKCNDCDYLTTEKRHLKIHMLRHINSDVKKFKCSDCNYLGTRKYNLKIHMLRHQ